MKRLRARRRRRGVDLLGEPFLKETSRRMWEALERVLLV